ncbi:MAG: iron-containing alcohol dehydrogenase [Kiritimatiellae bacterium]|nr:iron-containing alcohol dehydrogenase [Kiritimatiellia bacterium]
MLAQFKGRDYVYGLDCFDRLGGQVAELGKRASVVTSGIGKDWGRPIHERTTSSLAAAGVARAGDLIPGAKPNAPREDVFRIATALKEQAPDVVVAVGGGSVIDAAKAAAVCWRLGGQEGDIDGYFGVGQVSERLGAAGVRMPPLVAAQLASGSAAHLTKYSNVTDTQTWQKKLIVDEAIVPPKALFDYAMTATMSKDFTSDGALDGVAHALEVFYGAKGDVLAKARPVALLAIDLIVNNVKAACADPDDLAAREALGLGTDLGGYAIMIGGTNGGHLTSFSLVDVLAHGRACALMNPYYTVFFAPAIEPQLRELAGIFRQAGYLAGGGSRLKGRELGVAVAEAMLALSRDIGFPTTLGEVEGFSDAHIERALTAAKNPQLEMKLKNMPVPLSAALIDDYMGPILEAAKSGDFGVIRSLE